MSYRGSVNGGFIFFIGASRTCIASRPSTQFRDGHGSGELERSSSDVSTHSNAQRREPTSATDGAPYHSRNGSTDLSPIPTGNHPGCGRSRTKFVLFDRVAQYRFPVSLRQNTFEEPGGHGCRGVVAHVVLQRLANPIVIWRMASWDARNARSPSASIRKRRFARPPRSAVGSPTSELT